ncbi:S8 family peptidase [Dactylosporangium sp. NPDC049525]|uniref:S8 family peptidase n=1 Tax=Dactylosporangium sp. NPDC049525 TaxID=3154730 RepID=UPI00341DC40B
MTSNPLEPSREPPGAAPSAGPGRRELIVVGADSADLRISPTEARSLNGSDLGPLATVAAAPDVVIRPLFGASEERVRALRAPAGSPDSGQPSGATNELIDRMSRFYHVDAPDDRLDELAAQLRESPAVEAAYVKPPADLAVLVSDVSAAPALLNAMAPTGPDAPPVTPDFSGRQGYLDAAPGGIDARWAWTQPGGRGAGVRIVDCEWGWRFTHEDLTANQGGVVAGTADADPQSRGTNHGTAVLGEISGDVNTVGIVGIASDAFISASAFSVPTAQAIRAGADRLGPGDILLLEIHRGGPRYPGGDTQFGFIAVEWWPDDYLAVRYAVNRGVIVVEAAGNGSQDLDDPIYDRGDPNWPGWWRNPFRRTDLDSGAVVVGAGAPSSGNHGPDRSRLGFSNYGQCVDAQGWGREVVTTGYGDLQGGNVDVWYTSAFSGTSSASPMIVGALACTQGVLRAHGRPRLSPARARELLRSTGSPQQDALPSFPATQRIGNRPDLRQLIAAALQTATWTGVQFRGQIPARGTQRWFTFNWPAHWHVLWTVMPTSPRPGGPQLRFRTMVERANDRYATYWIEIVNLVDTPVDFEGRFAVLGW